MFKLYWNFLKQFLLLLGTDIPSDINGSKALHNSLSGGDMFRPALGFKEMEGELVDMGPLSGPHC